MIARFSRYRLRRQLARKYNPRGFVEEERLARFLGKRTEAELRWLADLADDRLIALITAVFLAHADSEDWSLATVRLVALEYDPEIGFQRLLAWLERTHQDLATVAETMVAAADRTNHPAQVLARALAWLTGDRLLFPDTASALRLLPLLSDDIDAGRKSGALETEVRAQRAERGSILRTDHWLQLVELARSGRGGDLADAIFTALSEDDIDALLLACDAGSADERARVVGILARLASSDDARLPPDARARFVAMLRERVRPTAAAPWSYPWVMETAAALDPAFAMRSIDEDAELGRRLNESAFRGVHEHVRDHGSEDERREWAEILRRRVAGAFAQDRDPYLLLGAWMEIAPADVETFLVSALPLDRLGVHTSGAAVRGLLAVGTTEAIDRIRSLAAGDSPGARVAGVALQALGEGSQQEIEALASKWREERSAGALDALVHRYLHWVPTGYPLGRWRALLGPAREIDRDLWYESREGPALFILMDEHGGMAGWKLK